MFHRIRIIGRGRVGGAVATRLADRGHQVVDEDNDLVLLCVPDAAISAVARSIAIGPWLAHTSGATPLGALAPHTRRFGVHPLQTIVSSRGPEQLDGAWAAVTGENDEAMARGFWLARELGLIPFGLREEFRVLYHAGAVMASNYLVALHGAAVRLLELAGAPPDALVPLVQRVIDNRFELTGPIARGDWTTVEAHIEALRAHAPDLEPLYRALAAELAASASRRTTARLPVATPDTRIDRS